MFCLVSFTLLEVFLRFNFASLNISWIPNNKVEFLAFDFVGEAAVASAEGVAHSVDTHILSISFAFHCAYFFTMCCLVFSLLMS